MTIDNTITVLTSYDDHKRKCSYYDRIWFCEIHVCGISIIPDNKLIILHLNENVKLSEGLLIECEDIDIHQNKMFYWYNNKMDSMMKDFVINFINNNFEPVFTNVFKW